MQFSDNATKLGLVEEIDALCDSDSTTYPVAQKTRRINAALEKVVGKIIGLDGTWQFDDSNFTSLPIGVTNLVASQHDYSFDVAMLSIERVEVKDSNGIWHLLKPIDRTQIGVAIDEYQKTDGLPTEYDKSGGSIFLYPAPAAGNVTLASGLKVYFQRTASLFTATDTTKVPGFASPWHIVLAYEAALPYCATYKKDRVAWLNQKIEEIEGNEDKGITGSLMRFYAKREKDTVKAMSMRKISFR